MQKFSPLLNQLQQKGETFAGDTLPDPEARCEQDWKKTAESLISLIDKVDKDQVYLKHRLKYIINLRHSIGSWFPATGEEQWQK